MLIIWDRNTTAGVSGTTNTSTLHAIYTRFRGARNIIPDIWFVIHVLMAMCAEGEQRHRVSQLANISVHELRRTFGTGELGNTSACDCGC